MSHICGITPLYEDRIGTSTHLLWRLFNVCLKNKFVVLQFEQSNSIQKGFIEAYNGINNYLQMFCISAIKYAFGTLSSTASGIGFTIAASVKVFNYPTRRHICFGL